MSLKLLERLVRDGRVPTPPLFLDFGGKFFVVFSLAAVLLCRLLIAKKLWLKSFGCLSYGSQAGREFSCLAWLGFCSISILENWVE